MCVCFFNFYSRNKYEQCRSTFYFTSRGPHWHGHKFSYLLHIYGNDMKLVLAQNADHKSHTPGCVNAKLKWNKKTGKIDIHNNKSTELSERSAREYRANQKEMSEKEREQMMGTSSRDECHIFVRQKRDNNLNVTVTIALQNFKRPQHIDGTEWWSGRTEWKKTCRIFYLSCDIFSSIVLLILLLSFGLPLDQMKRFDLIALFCLLTEHRSSGIVFTSAKRLKFQLKCR